MGPETNLQAFTTAHAGGALVVDLREPREYLDGHVPGALLIPLAQLLSRLSDLPTSQPLFVICASGDRSRTATGWLRDRGFDASSVTGGINGWVAAGHRIVQGTQPDTSVA